ncbi:MAG: tetratricopeptide repeat protein [Alphaproteobacteria bacterium]|nr:tetratricopeptide repeat protein [Alphaproteobacteria bacterium]
MPGREPKENTPEEVDPEADFFGEDVDWLDDDDSEVVERKRDRGRGTPPPPPSLDGATVLPKEKARAEWERRNLPFGSNLSSVDTLIAEPWDGGPDLGDLDTVEIPVEGPSAVSEDDLPTTHVSEDEQRAAIERARGLQDGSDLSDLSDLVEGDDGILREEDDAPVVPAAPEPPPPLAVPPPNDTIVAPAEDEPSDFGEDFLEAVVEDEGTEVPLVQTKEPAPIRMEIPEQRVPTSPTLTPWSQPRPTLPPFVAEGENNARMTTATLITEASVAGPEERGELLFRAGWVFRHRLGDLQGAEALYRDALTSTCRNPWLYRELADVCIQLSRWEEAAVTLHERATLLDGVRAAESLRESAVVHLRRLQNPGDGVARLWDSLEANPEDYASLVLLRESLSDVQPERAEILERIARLTGGALAAEAWSERGRILRNSDPEGAIASYEEALAAQPDNVGAFVALEQLHASRGDAQKRAALYAAEAERDPSSAGWWSLLAGRDHVDAGEYDKADAAYTRAMAEGWSFAAEERPARLFANGAWEPLVETLVRAAKGEGSAAAPTWFRVGWIRERHLEDVDGALEAYREAAALEPAAQPVRDAIRRVLERKGDAVGQIDHLLAELEGTPDVRRPSVLFRLGEAAELAGRFEEAKGHLQAALQHDADLWPARAALTRVLRRLGDEEGLVAAYRERAARVRSPELRAHFLFSAASVGLAAREGSHGLLLEALQHQPGHLPALELLGSVCTTAEHWSAYARALNRAAAAVADTDVRVHLHYLSGRVHAARTGDLGAAREALASCLGIVPDFEPASVLAFDLAAAAGDLEQVCQTYRDLAEASNDPRQRAWFLFASAVLGDPRRPQGRVDLEAALAHAPDHEGARRLLAEVCMATDDHGTLVASYRQELQGTPTPHTARVAVRLAQLFVEQDRTEDAAGVLSDLATMAVDDRPLRPAARLARHAAGIRAETALLDAIDQPWAKVERASLLARRRRDREVARDQAVAVLDADEKDLGAALVLSRIGGLTDDPRLMARAQEVMARHGGGSAMRFANAMWAGDAYEQFENPEKAAELYALALELVPTSEAAALGLVRCHLQTGDAAALLELAKRPDLDPMSMAVALTHLDDMDGAIALLRTAARSVPALPALLQLEALLEAREDWNGAYQVLLKRLDVSRDESQRDTLQRKRRWVLAENLPGSDEAWDLYRDLHAKHPEDREVTEALARIAGARKETGMAIGLLSELASTAATPDESARYKRRVAEAHLSGGDRAAARQAFLDALDYAPSDAESMAGLKKMATEEEDWPGLVQILEREAGLSTGDRLLEIRREIATLQQERIQNAPVAVEAWRSVLELAPQDLDALDRLLVLTESTRGWTLFVEIANVRAALSTGAERTMLLRRIGVVSQDELHRDDAIRYFERAVTEEPPDFEAAQRLEQHFRQRGDWKGVARALEVQGRAAGTDAEKVEALEKAARLEIETRHDRDAAALMFTRLLAVKPDHEVALRFMASHLFEAGRFDEAMPICERLEPVVEKGQDLDDFDTRMELAQFYFYYAEMLRLAEEDGALERYERALELNATHLASLEAVGPLLCKAGKWSKAEVVYRQLLQLSGGQGERHKVASTYTQLGLVERALGRPEKAQKRFQKALETYPNHVDALKGMARLLEDREDWSNLLNIYNNVIYHASVAEDVIAGYMTKGRVLDDYMARPDKAAQHYQRSLDFKADQPFAYLRLAELSMRKDDFEGASTLAARALKVETSETDEVRHLLLLVQAAARANAGKTAEATALLDRARELPAGNEIKADALADLEMLRQFIKQRLPAT